MAGSYDGSIRIDTKVDTAGFNAGMAKVTNSAGSAFKAIASKIALVTLATAAIAAKRAILLICIGDTSMVFCSCKLFQPSGFPAAPISICLHAVISQHACPIFSGHLPRSNTFPKSERNCSRALRFRQ